MRGVGVVRRAECGVRGGVGDKLGEVRCGDGDRWSKYGVRVGGIDGVEADEGVEVHDAAALVLGDLAVGDPQRDPVAAFEVTQRAGKSDHGAAP